MRPHRRHRHLRRQRKDQAETQGGMENTGLDAIVHNKYAHQPEKLRAWQSTSRIERAPQREEKSAVAVLNTKPKAA